MLKQLACAGLARIFGPVTLCLLLALPAQAASWEWSSRSGRERLEVRLDAGMREQATARTGPTSVDIRFNAATDGVAGQSRPAPGSLITAIDPVGDTLRLTLRDAAFGYIVQRGAGSVSVEVFADPFGARWQPSDARVLPPLPSVTPPAPTQTATQTMGQTMGQTAPPAQAATRLPSAQVSQGQSDQAVLSPLPSVSPVPPVSPVPAVPSGQAIQAQSGATGTPGAQAQPPVAGVQSGAASAAVVPGVAAQPAAVGPGGAPQSGAPGQTGTAHVPAAQGQLPQGQTQGGGTTLFQVNVGSPGQAAPTANGGLQTTMQGAPAGTAGGGVAVSVNMTPAGMPGAAASGPIAVASGSALPAQVDPPDATAPSNAVLDAITRKIESLPAQVEVAPPVSSLDEALLSTPVAPAVQPAAPGSTQTQAPAEHTTPPAGNGANGKTPHVSVTVAESARGAGPQTPQAASPAGNAANGVLRTPVTVSGPDRSVATQAASQPQGRLVSGGGDGLRARFNTGGPDAWPVADGLSTTVSDEAASDATVHMQVQSSAPAGAHGDGGHGEAKKAEPEVIYVDEDGKPVPKPLDVNGALAEARTLIQSLQFEPARDLLVQLKEAIMPPEKREEMLYLLSDAITGMYNGKWLEGYEPIVASTSEAMNANLSSPQVPRALERLGMINLRTGNQQDAAGYFGALRNKYPMDSQVPECYYALGMEQLANGQYAEAVQNFQLVMQEYPESQVVRLASRFMAEALYKQGHYERTMTIVDFVDRRWPRIYLEDPDYLLMVADTQFRRGRLDDALQTYWAYYNLMPSAPGNDQLMLNVGTIYMMQGEMKSARTMYSELLKRYPDSQYAPLAVLRQGEEGIFEGNLSIDDLFAMFSRPNLTTVPEAAYRHLLQDYPGAGESVTAALRLAAWRLWNKEYSEAMNEAESFIRNHPDSLYAPRADEIILRAFAV
ncbi:MAG: tetratricopeptide repeat protein, partial [Deltaproteobacteria bacterium]|nr:tetratricopeptide repeat protein [Deltaproteobacteria bacterium]